MEKLLQKMKGLSGLVLRGSLGHQRSLLHVMAEEDWALGPGMAHVDQPRDRTAEKDPLGTPMAGLGPHDWGHALHICTTCSGAIAVNRTTKMGKIMSHQLLFS